MRALRLFRFGLGATGAQFGMALLACLLFGGASGIGSAVLWGQELSLKTMAGHDEFLAVVYMVLADLSIQVAVTVLLGPIFQAMAAFAAFRHSRGKPGSARVGLNFALGRYSRMFKPHAVAWLVVLLGLQFIIPGIIYWNQFALVDAEAAFGKSVRPIRRSRTLTKGYRRTIFMMALPWFLYSFPALVVVPLLASIHPTLLIVHQVAVSFFLFALFAGYGRLYLERTGQHEPATAIQDHAQPASPEQDEAPEPEDDVPQLGPEVSSDDVNAVVFGGGKSR